MLQRRRDGQPGGNVDEGVLMLTNPKRKSLTSVGETGWVSNAEEAAVDGGRKEIQVRRRR